MINHSHRAVLLYTGRVCFTLEAIHLINNCRSRAHGTRLLLHPFIYMSQSLVQTRSTCSTINIQLRLIKSAAPQQQQQLRY